MSRKMQTTDVKTIREIYVVAKKRKREEETKVSISLFLILYS